MKKLLLLLFLLAYLAIHRNVFAYEQSEGVCYSQCAAHKFVWQGDSCWDLFQNQCSKGEGDLFKDAISFAKDAARYVISGKPKMIIDVEPVFTSLFVCKPLIEDCIAPALRNCRTVCQTDQMYFAPDLSAGHPDSSFHGVYFDDATNQLYFKLVNNGMAYAWDIGVEAKFEYTNKRDGTMQGGRELFKDSVEHLIYLGARHGPPKFFGDIVGDFLVEQSLNGQYLHGMKSWLADKLDLHSDSKDYNVPNYWIKAVNFKPMPGYLNRITFRVDPVGFIPETWELNNTFILDIDLRPDPPRFEIENFSRTLTHQTLNSFIVNFTVKNTGEENGQADVRIYEGKYQNGKSPVYQSVKTVNAKSGLGWETTIAFDQNKESKPFCGNNKEYTIVAIDAEGNKTERNFILPIYVGSINGRVEDLSGKKVVGAKIQASTGEETIVNDMGFYHMREITTPGKITITASHPEFSKVDSKELDFKYVNEFDACKEGNLLFNSVNFILKDQEVSFTVNVKDSSGNPLSAQVLAVNSDWRFNETVNGVGPMPGMQPGKYQFIISAAGYKTISQEVNAVPNNQNLEFTLEKLNGRPDDTGLHLITPKLLWKKTLGSGERIISNMSDTKNGNLLVAYALDNKAKNSNLYFLDLKTGRQIKEASAPYGLGYEGKVALDASYDGGTVGLAINPGNGQEEVIKVFSSGGDEIGTTTIDKKTSVYLDVSPDGYYLCTNLLLDKGLHRYTQYETEGKGDDDFNRNPALCGDYFLRNNNMVNNCKGGLCEETISGQQVRVIGDITEGKSNRSTIYDSAFNDQTVVVRTYEKLYYLGGSSWNKEIKSDNMYKSAAVSPGGMYTIVTEGGGSSHLLKLKIFGNTGGDKTPDFPYKDVKFVFANDKGLFFAQVVLNRIEFYRIGEFQNEDNPEETTKEIGLSTTTDLSRLSGDTFVPAGEVSFSTLTPGLIYRAEKNIRLKYLNPTGALTILAGTAFSKEYNHKPVLLKGQLTAEFGSPMTVYAIKFDRYDLNLFQSKLSQFIAGTLADDEYFIIKNIHTKFTIQNNPNKINVLVDSGQVKVAGDKFDRTVTTNKQISIDENNNVKESITVSSNNYIFMTLIILAISVVLLFVYRKTKIGSKIIEILKMITTVIVRILKKVTILIFLVFKRIQKKLLQKEKK